MSNGLLQAFLNAANTAKPVDAYNQGRETENILLSQVLGNQAQALGNQQTQQGIDLNSQLNPLKVQGAQQNLDIGAQSLQQGQYALNEAARGALVRDLTALGSEAIAMPKNTRRSHILNTLSTVDFQGLNEQELIEEINSMDDDELEAAINGMISNGQGMSEYQRRNLDLQERRLNQTEGLNPYQEEQLRLRNEKLELEKEKQRLTAEKDRLKQSQDEEKKKNAEQAAKVRASMVSNDLDRAIGLAGNMTTGFLGARTKGIEGTESYDLSQILDGIKANIGFKELNEMRQNSPTGGALGNVTERELQLLQRVLGSLEQEQGKDQFVSNAKRAKVLFDAVVNGTSPIPFTQEEFDALPKGGTYIDPDDGKLYRKQ